MAGQFYEITTTNLTINNVPGNTWGEVSNVLTANTLYPSAGRGSVATVKTIPSLEKIKLDFLSKSFEDKILFKEEINGNTQIKFKVTQTIQHTEMEKFIISLFQNLFTAGAKFATEAFLAGITAGIGNVLVGSAINTTIDVLLKKMFDSNGSVISIIGEGSLDLPAGSIVSGKVIPVELKCSEQILTAKNNKTGAIDHFSIVSPTTAPMDRAFNDPAVHDQKSKKIIDNTVNNGSIGIVLTQI